MASFTFRKAARTAKKIRVAVDGVSGSGKTYSLLRLAHAMKAAGLCQRIAVIDTENGGTESYANDIVDGMVWDFEVCNLTSYAIPNYIDAMDAATQSGFDCVIIDSLSHAWMGKDGALDVVDRKGGRFDAWKDVTPLHRRLLDAVIHCPAHVLASMRSKTEYVVEKNEKGKNEPRKVGMAPVQRDGVEYEFDLYGSIDLNHSITITKSRCSAMQDAYQNKPDAKFWAPLIQWLSTAAPPPPRRVDAAPQHADSVPDYADEIRRAPDLPTLAAVWKSVCVALDEHRIDRAYYQSCAQEKDWRKGQLMTKPAATTEPPQTPAVQPEEIPF